ncbi:MAG: MarR family transcriptional regulator [Eubacteriales bacterium]|nr:MarR family transcriptional regulator [Eubacteriales bacterium]
MEEKEIFFQNTEMNRHMARMRRINVASILPGISMKEFGVLHRLVCERQETRNISQGKNGVSESVGAASGSSEQEGRQERDGQDGMPLEELAREIEGSPPAVSRTLRGLEEKGLLRRMSAETDRRKVWILLTPEGEERHRQACEKMRLLAVGVSERMGEGSMEQLLALFGEMLRATEETIREIRDSERRAD